MNEDKLPPVDLSPTNPLPSPEIPDRIGPF